MANHYHLQSEIRKVEHAHSHGKWINSSSPSSSYRHGHLECLTKSGEMLQLVCLATPKYSFCFFIKSYFDQIVKYACILYPFTAIEFYLLATSNYRASYCHQEMITRMFHKQVVVHTTVNHKRTLMHLTEGIYVQQCN